MTKQETFLEAAELGALIYSSEVAASTKNEVRISITIENVPVNYFDNIECETHPVGEGIIYKSKIIETENNCQVELRSKTVSVVPPTQKAE